MRGEPFSEERFLVRGMDAFYKSVVKTEYTAVSEVK